MINPYDVLEKCRQHGSTIEKQNILRENESELLKKVLKYALDPYYIFGVKKYNFADPGPDCNWDLIFKLCDSLRRRDFTGDAAQNQITATSKLLNKENQAILHNILQKDLKCGVAEGIVNKVFKGLISEFEVQLAQPSKFLRRVRYPCIVQPKLDGVRAIALTNPKEQSVTYYSRNGKEFFNFGCFNKELLSMSLNEPKMFDGEVIGPKGQDFKGIMEQVRRKYDVEPKGLSFYLFDWMPIDNFTNQSCLLNQSERTDYLDELEAVFVKEKIERRVWTVDTRKVKDENELMLFYDKCVEDGFEGVIIKDIEGEYEFKRSVSWIKMKPDNTEDLKIIDIQEGTGKYKGMLGAIIVERDGVKINVGSGFKDDERYDIEKAQSEYVGKIVEVKYDSVTPDGSLRFPRFIQIRDDK